MATAHIAAFYLHLAERMTYQVARWNCLDKASRYALAASR